MAQYWTTLPKLGLISANIRLTLIIASLVLLLFRIGKSIQDHMFIFLKKEKEKEKKRLRNTTVKFIELSL